jgi:hypothetical protein
VPVVAELRNTSGNAMPSTEDEFELHSVQSVPKPTSVSNPVRARTHWARKLQTFGHTVKLMALEFVKPYVTSNKNDAADAEAISEAMSRPTMRFVPIKNVGQQSVLSLHCVRQGIGKPAPLGPTKMADCSDLE